MCVGESSWVVGFMMIVIHGAVEGECRDLAQMSRGKESGARY